MSATEWTVIIGAAVAGAVIAFSTEWAVNAVRAYIRAYRNEQ